MLDGLWLVETVGFQVCRFEAAWLTASFVGLSHMFSVQNRAKVKQLAGCDLPDLRVCLFSLSSLLM